MLLQLLVRLGADAIDLAAGQRPDQGLQVFVQNDGNTIGLVKFASHFGQQLVGRHADRAGQAGVLKNRFLDQARQHPPAFALAAGYLGKVDVHLVHPPVFHQRGDVGDDGFKALRVMPVLRKVHRQQHRLRAQLGRFHQAHGRAHTKLARRVGGCGNDAAPGVVAQQRKFGNRDVVQGPAGVAQHQVFVNLAPPATDHHRQALELRVAQQLHRRVKRVHIQVGDAAQRHAGCGQAGA